LVGLSGGGKSERVAAVSRAVGLPVQTVLASSRLPEDINGALMVINNQPETVCILPQGRRLSEWGFGTLFIDELSTARESVQEAFLGLVNDRRIGDVILPRRVRILCAMNPPEYTASGYSIGPALANRMAQRSYEVPNSGEWVDWLTGVPQEPLTCVADAEQKVIDNWDAHVSNVKGLIGGFMKSKPANLHAQPLPDDPKSSDPWPSHRMWAWAAQAITTVRCLGMPKELENEMVKTTVGEGVMKEWSTWVKAADLPTAEEALNLGWQPDTKRLDITLSVLLSVRMFVLGLKDEAQRNYYAVKAWGLLQRTVDAGIADLVVQPASLFVRNDLAITCPDAHVRAACEPVVRHLGKKGLSGFARTAGAP
jgi:hypothetical protein